MAIISVVSNKYLKIIHYEVFVLGIHFNSKVYFCWFSWLLTLPTRSASCFSFKHDLPYANITYILGCLYFSCNIHKNGHHFMNKLNYLTATLAILIESSTNFSCFWEGAMLYIITCMV